MPVAESELVAGYMVEYTGFRFLFFFIGEFGTAFAFAAHRGHAVPRRLGDPRRRRRRRDATSSARCVLFAKMMLVAFLMFWVRFTYPRLPRGPAAGARLEVPHPASASLNILLTGMFKVAF